MHKHKKLIILLIVVFGVVITGIGAGLIAFNNFVRPPTVPQTSAAVNTLTVNGGNNSSSGSAVNSMGEPVTASDFEERKELFFTFLIFGLTEGLHANTVMVAAYDGAAREAYIISIPRDTEVDFQRNRRKIVAAYPVGRLNGGGHEGGVERMKYEVSTLIGFRPDFYISIDYEAFIRMIDAVGGVEVEVPFHMVYDDPYQNLHINLPQGLQVLNGRDALHFARYRTGGQVSHSPTISDYQRMKHQQQVVSAALRELLTPSSILRIPEFVGIFNEYVDSDLSAGELLWFANEARIGGTDALNFYTLPTTGTSGPPMWYELPDRDGIIELVNRTVNPFIRNITADDLRLAR